MRLRALAFVKRQWIFCLRSWATLCQARVAFAPIPVTAKQRSHVVFPSCPAGCPPATPRGAGLTEGAKSGTVAHGQAAGLAGARSRAQGVTSQFIALNDGPSVAGCPWCSGSRAVELRSIVTPLRQA
jgi:hypothetical protein